MKTLGLIGGMSWESTAEYYALINRGVNAALGKNHSAKIVMESFDFQRIEELQYAGDWVALEREIIEAGKRLKAAGADLVVLCTNTMHKVVGNFEAQAGLPLIHIADAVGQAVKGSGLRTVGLLGTIFTMEQDFYKNVLVRNFGLTVLTPDKPDRDTVNTIIYQELVKGHVRESSRTTYLEIMDRLVADGAEGIILGCTEIGLLVKSARVPLFDSTALHAAEAVSRALSAFPGPSDARSDAVSRKPVQ